MRDWREILNLAGVDLQQSYLLTCRHEDDEVLLELDVQLTSQHPLFEPPRPAEGGCYRAAELVFPAATQLCMPSTPNGLITRFVETEENKYLLEGDFGQLTVTSDTPFLRLEER